MNDLSRLRPQTDQALAAGREAHRYAQAALEALRRAKGWGIYDLLGGGLVSGLIKHGKMDDAQRQINGLRQALARHQRALKYSRFQPGNKGGKQVARFPERKSKEVA